MDQSTGAACLDGSAPGYYFSPGKDEGADKFVVYFLGGGFCSGTTPEEVLKDCYSRS